MSIYPVRLSEWFSIENGYDLHSTAYSIVQAMRCLACDKKVRWRAAIGHHSLPFGHGDLFCSWKCCNSGKIVKIDKRRERRLKRKMKGNILFEILEFREKK